MGPIGTGWEPRGPVLKTLRVGCTSFPLPREHVCFILRSPCTTVVVLNCLLFAIFHNLSLPFLTLPPLSFSLALFLSPHYILLYSWWCLGGRHPRRWPPSPSLPFPSHEKRFQLSDWILFLPDLHCSVRAPSIFWLTRRLFIRPKPGKVSVPL